jgi:hypothetical protein
MSLLKTWVMLLEMLLPNEFQRTAVVLPRQMPARALVPKMQPWMVESELVTVMPSPTAL